MLSFSFSLFHWRSSSSLLFQLHFILFALFLTPPYLAHVPPFLFVHLPFPLYIPLSLFRSRIPLIFRLTSHASSRSCFRSRRFRALLSSPTVIFLYPCLYLSLSILYTTHFGGALPSPLAPLNYDHLTPFISRGVPTSFSSSSSSSAPSATSVSFLFSLSFSL